MTGTPCTDCKAGHLVVYTSRRSFDGRKITQYYQCYLCGAKPKPNKVTVDAPPIAPKRNRVYQSSTQSTPIDADIPVTPATINSGDQHAS